tara:strand:+ start:286 stop:726 length:441 start_codon:yes stop_codon:yes gene_type:complete
MGKFIKINVVNSGAPVSDGRHLINVEDISAEDISYVPGTGVLTIGLKGTFVVPEVVTTPAAAGPSLVQKAITCTIATNKTGAAGVPTFANTESQFMPDQAVFSALTANPGGVQSSVQLGSDKAATPLQMYFQDFAVGYTAIAAPTV